MKLSMETSVCDIGAYYCEKFPHVKIFGITLLEPATVLTDLLITGVCFYALYKLHGSPYDKRIHRFFKTFLLTMGLATAVGGVLGHGFFYLWDEQSKIPGWYLSMISVAMFERMAILHAKPLIKPRIGNFFAYFNIIELLTFITITAIFVKFIFVELHAIYGLFIVVFSFEFYVYSKHKDKGSWYIFLGTGFAALAALTHAFHIAINEWFNHNDISHIFMAFGIYFYYLGAKNLKLYEREN